MAIGVDPVTNAAAYYGANRAFGGSNDISAGQRRRNEMEDVRRLLEGSGGLTEQERAFLGAWNPAQATTDDLLGRYRTYSESDNAQFKALADQLYGSNDFGIAQSTNQYAYDTFKRTFGREPTSTEFAQILPIFGGAEGRQRGAAAIAQMFDAYKQTPEYLKTQASQYSDELAPLFQQTLGREGRADELDYFGQRLAGGQSEYEIRQLLEALPEFQERKDRDFRGGLASELEGYDLSFFDKAKENVIGRAARNNGGYGTSSALDFALTSLMGEIAEKRGQYLAGISEKQYGGNKDAARADYTYNRDRYFGDQDYTRRRNDQEEDYYRGRADDDRDYTRQYNDYMAMQNRNRGGGPLHTRDWINIGAQGLNTASQFYGASQYKNPYDYLSY